MSEKLSIMARAIQFSLSFRVQEGSAWQDTPALLCEQEMFHVDTVNDKGNGSSASSNGLLSPVKSTGFSSTIRSF